MLDVSVIEVAIETLERKLASMAQPNPPYPLLPKDRNFRTSI
jgi:hypothetical protein